MPIVSVLLPCFNASQTLDEALDSLFSQTLTDFEIIAVDDGSTDNTLQILQQRADMDNRLKWIKVPHRGLIDTLNIGLRACQAPYIARMDSDDRAHPERLAKQITNLEQHPDVGVISCRVSAFPIEQVREGFRVYIDWLNRLLNDGDIKREIFIESPLPHPSVTYRKNLIQAVGGYQDNGWAEDYDLWLRLYLENVRFAKLPQVLLEWRERPERLTRTDSRYSLENFLRLKAHYLAAGPLQNRDAVLLWGAGMNGRRLSKHLIRMGIPLIAFIDVDPKKIGHTKRGLPIISPDKIAEEWKRYHHPALVSAVSARKARPLIREYLNNLELKEGVDWWFAA
jgi:glycosyltransferase involved in cell wall biosynthesis